ncbi:hypothetical protein BX616_001045 [Lobosporangium transversale]|uniref:Coth protein-domain-containing protein n=1 Tax=Lobosporangium transversale TaxID=64571 RepID=A0A1Y2G8C8_9FUNG|nr:coth protein-domain-containing protein [Lobosporangium transversale]KAF9917421.1 hypothetical protein BX616_001045 [Lobosporangium transversale]ORZ04084.1 coth protein-domain-containing protein [Lobosporangium transversale]|eukprot:XP_021876361.1 coth protein-domain-containing protein [Lobosporangium transversale]
MVGLRASLAGLLVLATTAFADITFNVVGYPSTDNGSFGVSVDGKITKLSTNDTTFPVWSGTVPGTTSSVNYQYVELNAEGTSVKAENFTRTLPNSNDTHTYNEFFERKTTKWTLPHIPYVYLATWPSYTKVFNEDEIATIHATADPAQLAALDANPDSPEIFVNFRWIDHQMIYSQTNISFKTSGKSSKDYKKQAYRFKFETDIGQSFFSRPNIKLRSEVTDPTIMREKIYIDMLNSVGVPTQQGQYVRLFVNNKPRGLYMMVEDVKKSFIKQTVHGGDGKIPLGSLMQNSSPARNNRADLIFKGTNTSDYDPEVYESINLGNNPPTNPMAQLIQFMADLRDFDPVNTPDPVGYWNNTRLDLDGFLRNMAMEYLGGTYDNYWMAGSNYFIYFNPTLGTQGKWQWVPTDFDGTFGNRFPTNIISPYQTVYSFQPDHPLVSKLIIKNKEINALFEQTLKDIVGWAYNPYVLFPRIAAYNQMLLEDYTWDRAIVRTGPGKDTGFTVEDFHNNLEIRTKDMQTSLKGWIGDMSALVAKQLNIQYQNTTQDRVPPPPKPTPKGDKTDKTPSKEPTPTDTSSNAAMAQLPSHSALVAILVAAVTMMGYLL